jgi:hypothetical protein
VGDLGQIREDLGQVRVQEVRVIGRASIELHLLKMRVGVLLEKGFARRAKPDFFRFCASLLVFVFVL